MGLKEIDYIIFIDKQLLKLKICNTTTLIHISPNSNGTLLLNTVSEHNLRHVASHFQMRHSKRWTWRHPRYRSRAVLDHVFVPSAHMRFVARCFVPSDVTISTDHRPVICELNFRPRIAPKPSIS